MPLSAAAKRVLLLAGIGLLALLIAGFITGAIGSAFFGDDEDTGLLDEPHVTLAPEKITGVTDEPIGEHGEEDGGLPGGFVLTNTLLSSWIATAIIILVFVLATRRLSLVPRGLQNFAEWVVEGLYNFVQGVVGPGYARKFFPVIATMFLFVAVNAWLELLPIYQGLGFLDSDGKLKVHLLRAAPTDLNLPLALALVSFVFVEYWGLRVHGRAYLKEFARFDNLLKGRILTGLIDLFVGFLEAVSHFVRILSFTFRLFGNITAGQILLLVVAFLVPFVALLPIYGLELLVGFLQALIFAGLTLGFLAAVVAQREEEHT